MDTRSRHESDMLYQGYAEYLVTKRPNLKIRLAQVGIVLAGIVVSLLVLAVTLRTIPTASFIFFVLIIFGAWYLFRFTHIEYEYVIAAAELELDVIYGGKKRKKLLEIKFSEIERVAPADGITKEWLEREQIGKVIDACTSPEDQDVYYVLFRNGNEGKAILYLNMIQKTYQCFKFYKRSVVDSREPSI